MTAFILAALLANSAPEISIEQFMSGEYDERRVRAVCTVKDVFSDEVDPNYFYLILLWGDETVYAAAPKCGASDEAISKFVGVKASVTGIPIPRLYDQREKLGRNLQVGDIEDIEVLAPAAEDAFAVPDINSLDGLRPGELWRSNRCRFDGRVLAVWSGNSVLLKGIGRRGSAEYVTAHLASGPAPKVDDYVTMVGEPETDLYHYILTRAFWRPALGEAMIGDPLLEVSAQKVTADDFGNRRYHYKLHGHPVRMHGMVRRILDEATGTRIIFDADGLLLLVDVSALEKLDRHIAVGCELEVTGICIMDIERWQVNSVFPQIKGFFLVPRTAADLRVLKDAPWWTPRRTLAVIGLLVALTFAAFAWSFSLRVLAARRGRALFRAQIENAKSRLKAEERTRLAVELHDSLAQSLTGVSIQIETGDYELAAKALKACRGELRDCLWDLRSAALDAPDLAHAVLRTLKPHLDESVLSVRMDVPRGFLTDNAAHALLCIVRELAVNAMRHGGATRIKVAGAVDGGAVRVSVVDDGCGFDPATAPGMLEGHFGLSGIRERITRFGGTFEITSKPGDGTRAVFSIRNEIG